MFSLISPDPPQSGVLQRPLLPFSYHLLLGSPLHLFTSDALQLQPAVWRSHCISSLLMPFSYLQLLGDPLHLFTSDALQLPPAVWRSHCISSLLLPFSYHQLLGGPLHLFTSAAIQLPPAAWRPTASLHFCCHSVTTGCLATHCISSLLLPFSYHRLPGDPLHLFTSKQGYIQFEWCEKNYTL